MTDLPPDREILRRRNKSTGAIVEYVRADLVRAAMPINAMDPGDPELLRLAEVLGQAGAHEKTARPTRRSITA